jgi:GT2 family glycosyltransferase
MGISCIIVNWNTKELVLDCIRSIQQQHDGICKQVIVVDNASSDDSTTVIRKLYPDVRLVQNPSNYGFAKGNNVGISHATEDYVCFINSDCLILEGCFSTLQDYMEHHRQVGIIGPKLLWENRSLQLSCRRLPTLWNTLCPAIGLTRLFPSSKLFSGEHMGYFRHDTIRNVEVLVGAFMMVRKSALDEIGGMDESFFMYCEEVDWCKRISAAGWGIVFHPDARVVHYGGGSTSKEPSKYYREYCISNIKYWRKHHSRPSQLCYKAIFIFRLMLRIVYGICGYVCSISQRDRYKDVLRMAREGFAVLLRTSL